MDCSPEGFNEGPAPRAALMDAIHAVDATGQVYVGVPTFRAAYAAVGLDGLSALLGLPGVRQWAARAYPVLVRHRYRLPAWLIQPLFERASRRAAERAVQRSAACHDGACALPPARAEGER